MNDTDEDTRKLAALLDNRQMPDDATLTLALGELRRLRDHLAAQPAPRPHDAPGEAHQYDCVCKVCGQRGTVILSIEPQHADG